MSKSDRFKRLAENRETETSNPQKNEVIEKIVGDFEHTSNSENIPTDNEHVSSTLVSNQHHEQSQETLTMNTAHEQSAVTMTRNSDTEQLNVTQPVNKSGGTRIPKAIEDFEKRLKKPTIEETHTRGTWLIRNDLLKRLDKLARHQHRGFKTHLVNYALERVLDELETK